MGKDIFPSIKRLRSVFSTGFIEIFQPTISKIEMMHVLYGEKGIRSEDYLFDVNLYNYVSNNPTRGNDPFGLWEIERKGGRLAKATPEALDTIESLATKLKLNSNEWKDWLTDLNCDLSKVDTKTFINLKKLELFPTCNCEFYVPNTKVIDLSNAISWESWDTFAPFSIWNWFIENARKGKKSNEDAGFRVLWNEKATSEDIKKNLINLTKNKELDTYTFYGHGLGGVVGTASDDEGAGLIPNKYTKYGIPFLGLYACDSSVAQVSLVKSGHKSDWRRNVSRTGTFRGYEESASYGNRSSHKDYSGE